MIQEIQKQINEKMQQRIVLYEEIKNLEKQKSKLTGKEQVSEHQNPANWEKQWQIRMLKKI